MLGNGSDQNLWISSEDKPRAPQILHPLEETFGWKPNPRSCWKHAGATADCDLKWMMPSTFCLLKKVNRLWQTKRPLRLDSCTPSIRLEAKSTVMLEACRCDS